MLLYLLLHTVNLFVYECSKFIVLCFFYPFGVSGGLESQEQEVQVLLLELWSVLLGVEVVA